MGLILRTHAWTYQSNRKTKGICPDKSMLQEIIKEDLQAEKKLY